MVKLNVCYWFYVRAFSNLKDTKGLMSDGWDDVNKDRIVGIKYLF